jgi:F-type H+-transporting ATPase subunit delta
MLRGRASDLLVDSLQVINRKDRLAILDQILVAYKAAHRELLGQVEVYVSTAVPLSDEQRADIRERSTRYTGKEVLLVERVVPDLLGGVIVQIGDQKVDMSVRRDIELLASRFAARLSKEMLASQSFGIEGDISADEAAGSHDGRDEEP